MSEGVWKWVQPGRTIKTVLPGKDPQSAMLYIEHPSGATDSRSPSGTPKRLQNTKWPPEAPLYTFCTVLGGSTVHFLYSMYVNDRSF